MNKPHDLKKIENIIRRAFEVDRILPKVGPYSTGTLLGKMVVIGDDDRGFEDVLEDIRHYRGNITPDDLELWWDVMSNWLPILKGLNLSVVKFRCQGMGWKRIAKTLVEQGYSDRILYRTTLWRIFKNSLIKIREK